MLGANRSFRIVGLLAILPSRYYFKKFAACLRPEMNKKLAELQKACEAGVEMDTANVCLETFQIQLTTAICLHTDLKERRMFSRAIS